MKSDIKDFTYDDLKNELKILGEPAYKADQIFSWIYEKHVISFDEMKNVSQKLINELKNKYDFNSFVCAKHLEAKDKTHKFLWELKDGEAVETVFISHKDRKTVCVSTQVGCKIKCPFCASGEKGFKRNLAPSEIVNQIIYCIKMLDEKPTNIVFMGMGEPLDNYDNVVCAIKLINHPKALNIGARKITVSTCGIVPGINKLKTLGLQIELAISFHAPFDSLRDKLVPINKQYNIKSLIGACIDYNKETKRIITLEYVLINKVNDSIKDAEKLSEIAKTMRAKVNLIACNKHSSQSTPPSKMICEKFKETLEKKGINVTMRKSKGEDIFAACGQLAGNKNT